MEANALTARRLGEELNRLIRELGERVRTDQQRAEEAREVGALFALWRQMKGASTEDGEELRLRLVGAFGGYGGEYLAWLTQFGGWLTAHATVALKEMSDDAE